MKKRWIVLAAALILLGGCGKNETGTQADHDKLQVLVSFDLLEDFAEKIGGDRVKVSNLITSGGDPHDWEPTARDIALLEGADVFLFNGAGFEHWTDKVLRSLKSETLLSVETSAAVELLEAVDDHGHHGGADPHVWLDPANAVIQLESVRDAFISIDPEGEALYTENCAHWTGQLETLDGEFRQRLEGLPRNEIVVAHQAYGYLCHAYDLHQIAVSGLSPEGEPDPARMAEVIRLVQEHDVQVIFFEETASSKVAEAIARETGAATAVLSPLENLAEGEDYLSAMGGNLEALEAALA